MDPQEHITAQDIKQSAEKRIFSCIPVKRQLAVALGLLGIVFGATYIDNVFSSPTQTLPQPPTELIQEQPPANRQDPFSEIDITARAAYVWDVKEQRALYIKNADEQLPLASITKLMTALVAHELLEPDSSVFISAESLLQEGDSGLLSGERFELTNLQDLTLITSSNDGAHALAAAAAQSLPGSKTVTFVEAMNLRAQTLGLSKTYFKNTTGLDLTETESGSYGTARDIAFLMEYIVTTYPELLESTRQASAYITNQQGQAHTASNTNPAVAHISGIFASKTGYTDLAGGNLVIAYDTGLNHPVIISVLGSTYDGRFSDITKLAEAARAYVAHNQQ